MKKSTQKLNVKSTSDTKTLVYFNQTIEMKKFIDFVWFVEYTNQVLEQHKKRMVNSGNVSLQSSDVGILITTMELELVQEFTNVDVSILDYTEILEGDFLDTIVWSFDNYHQVLSYFMNALQILQIQTVLLDLTTNLPSLDDLMGDISQASHLLDDLPEEQKELLMNMQLNELFKTQDVKNKK